MMDLLTETDESNLNVRRSSRRKAASISTTTTIVKEKHKKVDIPLEDLYLQKDFDLSKFKSSPLETIYESPSKRGPHRPSLMSAIKLRRECKFQSYFNPSKIKRKNRKDKATRLKRLGTKVPSGKISLEQVTEALKGIYEDDDDNVALKFSPIHQKENIKNHTLHNVAELTTDLSNLCVLSKNDNEERVPSPTADYPVPLQEIDEIAPLLDFKLTSKTGRRSSHQFFIHNSNDFDSLNQSQNSSSNIISKEVSNYSLNEIDDDTMSEDVPSLLLPQKRKTKTSRSRGISKRGRGQRRDSGINKSIYLSSGYSDVPENEDDLSISNFQLPNTRSRRRSARLSLSSAPTQSTFGSMWDSN